MILGLRIPCERFRVSLGFVIFDLGIRTQSWVHGFGA